MRYSPDHKQRTRERVLADDLSQRLPGTTVINANGAIGAKEDATVEVNILRMDKDASGALQSNEHDHPYGVYVINHPLPIEVFVS